MSDEAPPLEPVDQLPHPRTAQCACCGCLESLHEEAGGTLFCPFLGKDPRYVFRARTALPPPTG